MARIRVSKVIVTEKKNREFLMMLVFPYLKNSHLLSNVTTFLLLFTTRKLWKLFNLASLQLLA